MPIFCSQTGCIRIRRASRKWCERFLPFIEPIIDDFPRTAGKAG